MAFAREIPRPVLVGALAFAAGFAVLVAHLAFGVGDAEWLDSWLPAVVNAAAGLFCVARAVWRPNHRLAWGLIGAAILVSSIGDFWWAVFPNPPYPSPADAFYLTYYPLVAAGLLLLIRDQIQGLTTTSWLDGLIGVLAVTAAAEALVLAPVAERLGGDLGEAAATIAYPIGDTIVVGMVGAFLLLTGRRPSLGWCLLIAGLLLEAIGDAIYSYQATVGTYSIGALDLTWTASYALIALAAWVPLTAIKPRPQGWQTVLAPCLFASIAVLTYATAGEDSLGGMARVLLPITLLVVFARMTVGLVENQRLLESAGTDPLTRLGNRGRLQVDLAEALEKASEEEPQILALYDLDGFKLYNDTFGHPAGDALLERLARRLAATRAPSGRECPVYRIGGDEFCLLVPGGHKEAQPTLAAAANALTERGEGFNVTSSWGAVELPGEASDTLTAFLLADQRMYAQKDSRRLSAGGQAKAVLVRAMMERQPELGKHVALVRDLALEAGDALGLNPAERVTLARAAELHDIGKVAIPDEILEKPGPLDEDEWTFVRQHTLLGERIVSSAPALQQVARIVRSTHERWDGNGYPDGLAGEEIPLEARIVFACDAFQAMTSDRPYGWQQSRQEAIAELRRCAGTQFDPRISEVLAGLLERRSAIEPGAGEAPASSGPRRLPLRPRAATTSAP
jgi:diguanylate cyclase (GGDEF)-like protein